MAAQRVTYTTHTVVSLTVLKKVVNRPKTANSSIYLSSISSLVAFCSETEILTVNNKRTGYSLHWFSFVFFEFTFLI